MELITLYLYYFWIIVIQICAGSGDEWVGVDPWGDTEPIGSNFIPGGSCPSMPGNIKNVFGGYTQSLGT